MKKHISQKPLKIVCDNKYCHAYNRENRNGEAVCNCVWFKHVENCQTLALYKTELLNTRNGEGG